MGGWVGVITSCNSYTIGLLYTAVRSVHTQVRPGDHTGQARSIDQVILPTISGHIKSPHSYISGGDLASSGLDAIRH